jgi:hypothetical protein
MNFSNVDGELDRQFPLHGLGRGADRPPYSSFRRDAYFSLPEPREAHRSAATPANQAACPGFCRDPLEIARSAAMLAVVGIRTKRGNGIVRRTLQLSIPRYDSLSDITRKSQATSQLSLVSVVSQ